MYSSIYFVINKKITISPMRCPILKGIFLSLEAPPHNSPAPAAHGAPCPGPG